MKLLFKTMEYEKLIYEYLSTEVNVIYAKLVLLQGECYCY